MAKLEELTALLVNEIEDLNNSVEKLDKINTQLTALKIKMDLTDYKASNETHQQHMASHLISLEHFQNHFDTKIKQAKIYNNWTILVFIVSLILGFGAVVCIIISYLG